MKPMWAANLDKGETKRGRGSEKKTPVFGTAQREGSVKVVEVPNVQRETVMPIIEASVDAGTYIHTDEFNVYDVLQDKGL